jgi:hypothetical protein
MGWSDDNGRITASGNTGQIGDKMDILNALLPTLLIVAGAIATGLAGIIGTVFIQWNNRQKRKMVHDQVLADMNASIENHRLAVQAAEQLGATNEERAHIAMSLSAKWNQMVGIDLPPDKFMNEAHVPTVVQVPLPTPTIDSDAKG